MLKRSTGVELLFEKQIRTTGRLFCRCTTGGLGGLDVDYSYFFGMFTVFRFSDFKPQPATAKISGIQIF